MSELISVIIPAYNHARSLPACLESVFAQTYRNIEVIVVNDGSTDHTSKILTHYAERATIITQPNGGAQRARNAGFALSKGEFVIFCDADVVMDVRMLEKLHAALVEHGEASFAYSSFKFGWKAIGVPEFSLDRLKKHNYIHTTTLIRRADFPGFDEAVKRLQDWDVWLTMAEVGKTGVAVQEQLFKVRVDGVSRIGSSWLPKACYRLPWSRLPWVPKRITAYYAAREAVLKKHGLV